MYIDPPDALDIEMTIDKPKKGKAAGCDQIPAELIKSGGTELKSALHKLVLKIWEEEQIPEQWKHGITNPIFKKGNSLNCENYRAITLLCTAYKVLANIVYTKLRPYAEDIIGQYQGGFRAGRSTIDQIFTIRQIQEKY